MRKVLIIDDEEDFCFFTKANLEFTGRYEVAVATGGKEGIKAASRGRPDLILLDIIMPEMDGFEVLELLKKNKKTVAIPVVMLTAKNDEASIIQTISAYAEHYIVKPVEMSVLEQKIEGILTLQGILNGSEKEDKE